MQKFKTTFSVASLLDPIVHHHLSTVRLDSMQFPRTIALLYHVLLGRHDENTSIFHSPDVEEKNFLYLIECSLCEFDRRSVLALKQTSDQIHRENIQLNKENSSLQRQVNEILTYSRRDDLIIHGIAVQSFAETASSQGARSRDDDVQ